MSPNQTAPMYYDVNKQDDLQERLLDDMGVDHEVLGIQVEEFNEDSSVVRLAPPSSVPREYVVSSELLRDLYEDSVIELSDSKKFDS